MLENSEKDGTPIEMATLEEIQTVIKKLKTGKSTSLSTTQLPLRIDPELQIIFKSKG
jgi:hypothetical protein